MPEFQIPSWLQPMSEEQRTRYNILENQVRDQAVNQLRQQIGVRQMQQDYQKYKAQKVDDITAQRNALMNNAQLLFGNNPQALVNLFKNDEMYQARHDATVQLNAYRLQKEAEVERKDKALEDLRNSKLLSDQDYKNAKNQLEQQALDIKRLTEDRENEHAQRLSEHMDFMERMKELEVGSKVPKLGAEASAKKSSLQTELGRLEKTLSEQRLLDPKKQDPDLQLRLLNRRKEIYKQLHNLDTPPVTAGSTAAAAPAANSTVRRKRWDDTGEGQLLDQ